MQELLALVHARGKVVTWHLSTTLPIHAHGLSLAMSPVVRNIIQYNVLAMCHWHYLDQPNHFQHI